MDSDNELPEGSPRAIWAPEREDVTIHGILSALSDPTRLEIVRQLAERGEQCPADFLGMGSKQNLTHHLRVLRDAGLIAARYEGRNKVMWLRRDLMDDAFPGLLNGVLQAVAASQKPDA
jgi:DNA-binding transcriptional ArsR family regulator